MGVVQALAGLDQGHPDLVHTRVNQNLKARIQDLSLQQKENKVVQNQILEREKQVIHALDQIHEREKQIILALDRILERKIEKTVGLGQFHLDKGVSLKRLLKIKKTVVLVLLHSGVKALQKNNQNPKQHN